MATEIIGFQIQNSVAERRKKNTVLLIARAGVTRWFALNSKQPDKFIRVVIIL
jgi:hypothetical protein